MPGSSINTASAQTLLAVDPGTGLVGENVGLLVSGTTAANIAPVLYLVDVAYRWLPEVAQSYLTGPTTHGLHGYQLLRLAWIAYQATGVCTLQIIADGTIFSYALPSTAGVYMKTAVVLAPIKGQFFQYAFVGPATGCQLFDADSELWVQPWGDTAGPAVVRAFTLEATA